MNRPVYLLLMLAGCADPMSPAPVSVTGAWNATTVALDPQGAMETSLVIHTDHRLEYLVTTYGQYPGQSAQDISFQFTFFGRATFRAGRMRVLPDSSITADRFYGPSSRVVQRHFNEGSSWPAGTTHYRVIGDTLVLSYTTAPVDAPVATEATFFRE